MGGKGPLRGLRIIEFAGLGPAPFCGMMLADHGADVIRIDRIVPSPVLGIDEERDFLNRSRRSFRVDLKKPEAVALIRRLCRSADGLIEGFRPGVMERLGLGPDVILADNPKLVYGRMTGWGQAGPYAQTAGHDINYIALSGALHAIGRRDERPVPPLNLVGDFGGGGMMLAFGMLAGLLDAQRTGRGQVVDCAMTDGSAVLMSMIYSLLAGGQWRDERGVNPLDGGAHFYDTYQTADGLFVAVGAVEPQFYQILLEKTGLVDDPIFSRQNDQKIWPALRQKLAARFREKTRDVWCEIFAGTDACFTPVLSMHEAPKHPHNVARQSFIEINGAVQPTPAPRYSATPTATPTPMRTGAEIAAELLTELGYAPGEADRLRAAGAIA